MAEIRNLSQLAKHFSDEAEAWALLERIRWPNGPICPHCGVIDHAYYLEPKNGGAADEYGQGVAPSHLEVRGVPQAVLRAGRHHLRG